MQNHVMWWIPAIFLLSFSAQAQPWPQKPLRVIVPNAPGGGSDAVARALADRLAPALGQAVVVENRSGAGGRQGAEFVAKSATDGYTLLLGTGASLITSRALYGKLAYDPEKSFAPVALLARTAYLLVVHPSVPATSVAQLIALARAKPNALTYASTGAGSPSHLAAELFRANAGISLTHVPYKGSAPGTLSVMQGETSLTFSNLMVALPFIASGRFRALGVTALQRSALAPELPTLAEAGLNGYEVLQFYSLVAPASTPEPVVRRLHEEIVKRFATVETQKLLAAQGTEISLGNAQELARLHAREIAKWSALIKQLNITAE